MISEPIHTSREKLSTKEMLIKIADSALQINRCIEEYNDDHYDDQEMLYENAAGIAYRLTENLFRFRFVTLISQCTTSLRSCARRARSSAVAHTPLL